ncbi:hypothetical protein CKO09_11805 [Chromatium weissei]|nr:hypothetical protein [Chromatium weissei]
MMKNQIQNKKQIAIGLFLFCFLIFSFYLLLSQIWSAFSSVDPRLGAGLVVASATILVSVISVLISKHLEQRALILAQIRDKKTPVYEKIVSFIFSLTFAEKLGIKQPTEKEVIKFMAEITQEIVIWGSDDMIEAFHKFKANGMENNEANVKEPYSILFVVEDLFLAIRKDLGHSNKNMSRGKILSLFINDMPSEFK